MAVWQRGFCGLLMVTATALVLGAEKKPGQPEPAASLVPSAPDGTTIADVSAFPLPGSAHAGGAELTMVDHVNRMAILRPDRTDSQDKYHQDLPHHVSLLPYAEVFFRGGRANLEDLPLGTHLFGWFHLGPRGWFEVRLASTDYEATVKNEPNERSPESPFCRVVRLEDDFTCDARCGRVWEVVSVDPEAGKLTARAVPATEAEQLQTPARTSASVFQSPPLLEGEQTFDVNAATQVWQGDRLSDLTSLEVGQRVLVNRTWATLYGPGRLTDIWVDLASRQHALDRQANRFVEHERLRGVPARIEQIAYEQNAAGVVTARCYAAASEAARAAFKADTDGYLAVAEPSLRTYDQGNDAKPVRYRNIETSENPPPGDSGLRLSFHMWEMLEGIRPGRTVRLWPASWPRPTLPREERLHQFDLRPPLIDEDGHQRTTAPFSRGPIP